MLRTIFFYRLLPLTIIF